MAGGALGLGRCLFPECGGFADHLGQLYALAPVGKKYGSKPDFKPLHLMKLLAVLVGVIALVAVSNWLLHKRMIARWALAIISIGVVVIFTKETLRCTVPHAAR